MFIFSTGLFLWPWKAKVEEKKSDIRTANLKRQDKEIRFKSKIPADCLSLNNGTARKS